LNSIWCQLDVGGRAWLIDTAKEVNKFCHRATVANLEEPWTHKILEKPDISKMIFTGPAKTTRTI